jgi:hypothetical protein
LVRERSNLAADAVDAARERAGKRPVVGTSAPSPAPVDPRPPVGREAAHVLGLILTEHRALLREGLELVRASHRRFPEEWLPAALAASDPQVREVVAELGGTRVAWLAATVPGIAAPPTDAVGGDWDEAWQATVSPRERAALVGRWRQADPGRACEWLAGRFRELDWEDRAAAIIALATELAPADEPLLDTALHDRRSEVRRIAMRLLARLPESAFTRLIEARARPLLVGQGLIRAGLAVTLPALDPELEAAGFGGKGPPGIGERAWLMRQLIGHVNPARWTEWLGAEPGPLVERALRTDEAAAVVAGWLDASATFADVAWSIALLSRPKAEEIASADVGVLVESLTADGRAVLTAAVGRSVSPATLARLAAACPAPWPRPVVDAVFAAVSMLRDAQYPDQAYFTLVRAAAVAVPPDRAEELASLAAFGGRVRPALVETIETIQFRAWLHSVFAAQPAPVTTAVTEGAR